MKDIINGFREWNIKMNKAEKTIEMYDSYIVNFVDEYQITVDNVNQLSNKEFAKQFIDDELAKGLKPGTINKHKNIISTFSNYLVFEDIIESNKFKEISSIKNDNHKIETYSTDEIESILNLVNEKCNREYQRHIDKQVAVMYKAIFNIFTKLALRNEEVCRIEINDINWNTGMMYVRCKGHKGEISHKSKMNKETLVIVKEWLSIRRTIEVKDENKNLLFISPLNKKGVSTDAIRKQMKNIQSELGIEGDKMIHTLRHTRISELIAKGADIKKVSMVAHHASQGTTEKYYCHSTDEMLDELANL